MDVSITFRRGKITDTFRARTLERAERLVRYEPRLLSVDLLFDEDHGRVTAEGKAAVPGLPPLVARAESDSYRTACDRVLDRLARQLRKERSRRVDHQAPPLAVPAP